MKYFLYLFLLLLFCSSLATAQFEDELNEVEYGILDYSRELPEDLLQSKCAVLVSVPPVSDNSAERGDWKTYSAEAHNYFRRIGIDPVAYFYIDDVFCGRDGTREYVEHFKNRAIDYIIILSREKVKNRDEEPFRDEIVITPFSGEDQLIEDGQWAYKDQGRDLENIMKGIYGITVRKEFVKTNHLIIDEPEFFEALSIIKGRRNENYPIDLRVDKLAVPKFEKIEIPANPPGDIDNNRIIEEAEEYNASVERLNFELDRQFSDYPWDYELIEYNPDEEEMWREGFLYILMYVHTSGKSIRQMLDYEINEAESEYITIKQKNDGSITLKTIPVDTPVYKFYIRSLGRDEIYIGETWDADETWQEALRNHLSKLIEKLKRP